MKILAEHLSDDDRFVARFRREALAVAKLVHPNIVQVYDTGNDGGQYYIVMEYVRGRSGAQLLQAEGKLDPETSVEIGVQACAGLDYAHRHGIIHRDVKPGNLMIIGGPAGGGDMTVKLADFGIARASEQTRITQVGSVVGTAAYLAPEQARGEEANPVLGRLLPRRRALPVPHRAPSVRGRLARRAGRPPAVRAAPAPQLLQRGRPGGGGRRRPGRARVGSLATLRRCGRARRRAASRAHRRVAGPHRADPGARRRRADLGHTAHAAHPHPAAAPAGAAERAPGPRPGSRAAGALRRWPATSSP